MITANEAERASAFVEGILTVLGREGTVYMQFSEYDCISSTRKILKIIACASICCLLFMFDEGFFHSNGGMVRKGSSLAYDYL